MQKPRVLVLGGCGFVGRHLIDFLLTNDLVSFIRVVDKTPPVMAYMNERQRELFARPNVQFRSANLINSASCVTAFADEAFDYVINLAGETKSGQTEPVYAEGILKLSGNCAGEAAKIRVKRFVELSSAAMHSDGKTPQRENCSIEPWTMVAKYKARVEQELRQSDDLPWTVLRVPIVYGVGDRANFTPRIIIAALYKHLGETMRLLWTRDLRLNTVHVEDVCAAIWTLCEHPRAEHEVFNIVDEADSTQGSLTDILCDIFGIQADYFGVTLSHMAKLDLDGAIEEINDKHMGPWMEILQRDGVANSPLTPFMDKELLNQKHVHVDGSKIKQTLGVQLRHPKVTKALVCDIINDFTREGLFPSSLVM